MPDASNRRAFYCQEQLWQTFTNLAMQRGTTVDSLINEAMTQYLQRGQVDAGLQRQPYPQAEAAYSPVAQVPPVRSYGAGVQGAPIQPPPAPGQPLGARVPPPAPVSNYRRPPSIFEESIADSMGGPHKPMVLASLQNQPPQYQQQPQYQQPAAGYGAQPPLYIIFANQRYTIDKDKYIIGRSSQLADLVIRDANISRKHCAVIFKNGAYYIKDLDSTNGIEYKGNRIDTKRIDEGDQFNICEFHFTFTYR